MFGYIVENRTKIFNLLRTTKMYLSSHNQCLSVSLTDVIEEHTLNSDQEEADTKVVLHCLHALQSSDSNDIIVRSPSGDTDIIVLLISLITENTERVFIDSGCGKNLSDVYMGNDKKCSLIGFHAFTGCWFYFLILFTVVCLCI